MGCKCRWIFSYSWVIKQSSYKSLPEPVNTTFSHLLKQTCSDLPKLKTCRFSIQLKTWKPPLNTGKDWTVLVWNNLYYSLMCCTHAQCLLGVVCVAVSFGSKEFECSEISESLTSSLAHFHTEEAQQPLHSTWGVLGSSGVISRAGAVLCHKVRLLITVALRWDSATHTQRPYSSSIQQERMGNVIVIMTGHQTSNMKHDTMDGTTKAETCRDTDVGSQRKK